MSMRFAYLIAAHDKPDQLALLLNQLLAGENDDYAILHLDAKSPLFQQQREQFAHHISGRVHLIDDPTSVHWGHRSQVEATRRMLKIALAKGFTLAHHISGSDWPVKKRADIVENLLNITEPYPAFIEILGEDQSERMQFYWLRDLISRKLTSEAQLYHWGRFMKKLNHLFNIMAQRIAGPRSAPFGPWQKGWSWWSLPHDIAIAVLDALECNSERMRFTACPDEHFIPTIIANRFENRITSYHRYIHWSAQAWNPEILTADHVPAIKNSDAWFARKFDMDVDDSFLAAFPSF